MAAGVEAAAADAVTVRSHGLTPRQVETLRESLRASRGSLPGGAVAGLWVPGKGMWVGSIGLADLNRRSVMAPTLQMPIGSVTKTMTGTLALKLVERGRLNLTDPMSRWFPHFPEADRISLAMLLNMTSGIADYINDDFPAVSRQLKRHPHRYWEPRALIRKAAGMPRVFPNPGEQYSYSNTNTVIVGEIVRRVTEKPLPRLFRQRLFRPLEMDRSRLQLRGGLQPPHAQTYSLLYGYVHGAPPILRTTDFSLSVVGAAGAGSSTLSDLRRWGRALGTGHGLLAPRTQRIRTSTCTPISQSNGRTTAYCLAAVVVSEDSTGRVLSVWHNGEVLGATSYVGYFPQTKAVMVVQANQDGVAKKTGASIPDGMAAMVAEELPGLLGMR